MTDSPHALQHIAAWRTWGPTALEAALWGVLAINGARLAWLLLASPTPQETHSLTSAPPAPAAFPDLDPFYPAPGAPGNATPASLEGYRLHGVRHADGKAGAIIADAQGRQRAFRIGDALSAGIVLHAVGATHAVLAVDGGRHRLELPEVAGTVAARHVVVSGEAAPR